MKQSRMNNELIRCIIISCNNIIQLVSCIPLHYEYLALAPNMGLIDSRRYCGYKEAPRIAQHFVYHVAQCEIILHHTI